MYVSVLNATCVWMLIEAERTSSTLQLELQEAVSCPVWMLKTESGSFGIAADVLSC